MESTFRQLLKHSVTFGFGQLVFRLASIILLPVYTHYLTPLDYGVMALLDLTTYLMGIVIGSGIPAAASRAHFEQPSEEYRDRVWWTAAGVSAALATLAVVPALLLRGPLARLALGAEVLEGPYFFSIVLATLWVGTIDATLEASLQVRKASRLLVGISVGRLLLNVALNVALLALWNLGLAGILWGNLISGLAALLVRAAIFVRARKALVVDPALARGFWLFGWPLILTGLLSALMHQADRYLLRIFVDLTQLGLYSFAYQIGQGVAALFLFPFTSIWSVMVYEIAGQPDAKRTYALVFKYFVYGLSSVLLLTSLFARPLLALIAPPSYAPAERLVPVICLAYLLFSLHQHFSVPALLANRTLALVPVYSISAAANIALNLAFIPWLGAAGAAWSTAATFLLFSATGLLRYRRIDRYPYAFGQCALTVIGMVVTYVLVRAAASHVESSWQVAGLGAVAWAAWSVPLLWPVAARALHELKWKHRES